MMMYQVVGLADQNGRTYESKYGTYSKVEGIKLSEIAVRMLKEDLIDKLFHEDCWSLKKEPKKMTKEEIEKALGYEIEIDYGNNKKKTNQNNKFMDYVFSDWF